MSDSPPRLDAIILSLAESRGSLIPPEMLGRIVAEFTMTQFYDDREASLQFMRDMAEEYVVLTQHGPDESVH